MNFVLLSGLILLTSLCAQSQEAQTEAFRRIAVFPVYSDDLSEARKSGLWWSFREELTSNLQFVVASKQFLETKEVYQERNEISQADVILLSKHLEADVLMSLSYEDRTLSLKTYSAVDGMPLINFSEKLHSSFSAEKQINELANNLLKKWLASLPYQGVILEKKADLIQVNLGKNYPAELLQNASIAQIKRKNVKLSDRDYFPQMLRKLEFVSVNENIASYRLLPAENALERKNSELVFIKDLSENLRKKHLGEGKTLDTSSLLPELKASAKKTEENQGYSTKVIALINLLIVVALSL